MKKLFFILSIALSISLASCNNSNEDSGSKSTDVSNPSSELSSASSSSQESNVSADTTKQEPASPMTQEDIVKYKDAISLLKSYGDLMLQCIDAKKANKQIDNSTKQQIKELQDKLTELQKAGKMNQNLIELFNANNDMYNNLLNH